MRVLVALILMVVSLAGCSDDPAPAERTDDAFGDVSEFGVDEDHGVILGVVVDDAIVPVAGATVRVLGAELETSTDEDGRFVIGHVPAGTHFLNISKLNFVSTQISTTVQAGVERPELLRIQIARAFEGQPYLQQEHFQGHIACGYDVNFASSLCLNDYTRFVPGSDGIAPQLQETGLDDREHRYEIGAGWQTHIAEMTWEPSADSTSERMRGIISHYPRSASHWYASEAGEAPILVRMEQGVEHHDRQDEPTMVPPEGLPNMEYFAAVDTDPEAGAPHDRIAVAIEQSFEVFFTTFYHGKPPEGWSFIAGDGNPF